MARTDWFNEDLYRQFTAVLRKQMKVTSVYHQDGPEAAEKLKAEIAEMPRGENEAGQQIEAIDALFDRVKALEAQLSESS
ncbi:hypothetical protein [Actinomadura geliboluensis]|uniref:hypothetical protein n=1 Tax=Actinomadura geliboluensis TaxID=882440 RepID=UPI0036A0C45B